MAIAMRCKCFVLKSVVRHWQPYLFRIHTIKSFALQSVPGPCFTNSFAIAIQIRWKFGVALPSILIQWSLPNFALGTTAQLSLHVQNLLRSDGQQRNYSKAKLPSNSWIAGKRSLVKWAPVCPVCSGFMLPKKNFALQSIPVWRWTHVCSGFTLSNHLIHHCSAALHGAGVAADMPAVNWCHHSWIFLHITPSILLDCFTVSLHNPHSRHFQVTATTLGLCNSLPSRPHHTANMHSYHHHLPLLFTQKWGLYRMADILQMIFSNAFSWMKMLEFPT